MPNRVYAPDSEIGRDVLEPVDGDGEPEYPLVEDARQARRHRAPACATSPSASTAARPTSTSTASSTSPSSAPGRPASPPPVYAASEGLATVVARGRGDRRTGGHVVDDPQLPRLPARHLRDAAGPAGAQPGDPLRHPVLHRLAGHVVHAGSHGSDGRRREASRRTCCTPRAATSARAPSSCRAGVTYRKLARRASSGSSGSASTTAAP